jgi:hypothetical protein
MNVLEEANTLTTTDRQDDYGHPADDFARTATMWSAITGHNIMTEHVPLMMIALKISRECNKHKRDNLVDIAGYARTLELVYERSGHE